ncbi:AfsR/SARP family transcriptional regulator [Glycomyces terrestris]|uniref:AfsR/SARP family transcriptional regulator n=1 Tax=Glycomyces terrestris TaxID=2493553 RepID=A0A426URZ2_9ACTN|nr:AfsR/SARP family transcriptional regulator [Glycomyces terrestris]RRR96076.1 AfsR/SARP family transcriptional regulator [Glycomyces terrestris]
MTLDVRLLGPLEVRVDGVQAAIPRGNATTILALLLDDAGRAVPVSGLVAAVYGDDLPLDPETQVQNTVGVLRRQLGAARARIETVGRAYRFRIGPDELDTLRCKAKEAQARQLRREGRDEEAAAVLREALDEWRGPALADLPGRAAGAIGRRLDEYRLALLEQRIDADIDTGRAAGAVEELRQIIAAHDTRQRLTALLMRALHASGRTAEALEAFAALKDRLADALGADPDRELVALHTAILRDQPAADVPAEPPAATAVPAMLPRATPRFTGRETEIRALDRFLMDAGAEAGLAAVTGMGGIGKTALAVRWAHRVAHRFPDGQLYFNLRGFDPAAPGASPEDVLGEALAALGAPAVPAGLDERAGLYRTILAQRRVLVLLDNARDAAHVRPLLLTAPGSFTIVTSRDRLVGLDMGEGAEVVHLGPMPEAESEALLARRIGPERADAHRDAVGRIAAACGRLPLALTLTGSWAAADPRLALDALADRLEGAANVLSVLVSTDAASDPRTVFDCSYQLLDERDATAFRLFGLHPGPDLTPAAMASLMGAPPAEARAALEALAEINLVEALPEGRYSIHDLLRAYAAECFEDEVLEPERRAAALRMLEHYLHTAHRADRLLAPGRSGPEPGPAAPGVRVEPVPDAAAAAAWFDAEHRVLHGLLRTEAGFQADLRVWQLGRVLAERAVDRAGGHELLEAQTLALAAAERRGQALEQLICLGYLAIGHAAQGDEGPARDCAERAGALAARVGGPWAAAFAAYLRAGLDPGGDAALTAAREASAGFRDAGDRHWECRAVELAGRLAAAAGLLAEARGSFAALRSAAARRGDPLGAAAADTGFGLVAHREGRYRDALDHYRRAVEGFTAAGAPGRAGRVRELAGDTRQAMGDRAAARTEWRLAEQRSEASGARVEAARVRAKLHALQDDR